AAGWRWSTSSACSTLPIPTSPSSRREYGILALEGLETRLIANDVTASSNVYGILAATMKGTTIDASGNSELVLHEPVRVHVRRRADARPLRRRLMLRVRRWRF
ncbi:MAG TPA: hypothetical protein VL049_12680, partial [Candidatus Dormibacteraeota bacterium]|nr:hypothetical protein [Candidatus Dormibacteraeota bacterium]